MKKQSKYITFFVSDEELQKIKREAEKTGLKHNAFCKMKVIQSLTKE
ncbi:hypothetical protein M0R19_01920 [Candidatus Pacearchaeota archaeon]|nr:hypothetical protein [Candidatus Pacearchaeota archaeon]